MIGYLYSICMLKTDVHFPPSSIFTAYLKIISVAAKAFPFRRNFAVHDGGARGEDAFGASRICKSIRFNFYSRRNIDSFEMIIIVEGLHGTS